MKRILIVAMAESVHTTRWIAQIAGRDVDIHLFPSIDYGRIHEELRNVTVHHSFYGPEGNRNQSVSIRGIAVRSARLAGLLRRILERIVPDYRTRQLRRAIRRIRPDVIHSLEIQAAGYLTQDARRGFRGVFPSWIVTNWGSDIYLFGRLAAHQSRIREVLASCDYYSCECRRDIELARAFGFNGKLLPVIPNTGGFDLKNVAQLRAPGPVSGRRLIMLKGYQGWAGRALAGLRALERCADQLKPYEIAIYSSNDDVRMAAELFTNATGVPVRIVPKDTPHREILALHGAARMSIGLSISDAISTSLLEAMAMGSFPIQSWTSCADEWITNGETGFLVPPEDPDVIESAIRKALRDNPLVDDAAARNWQTISERLDGAATADQVYKMYCSVMGDQVDGCLQDSAA